MNMSRIPALQFYPRDWKSDLELQSCSLEARGLWIELLCIMHESDPYGHLLVNGVVPSESVVSRLVGIHPSKYRKLLKELFDAGVVSYDGRGAIYSRRMVKDEHLRQVRREAGSLGGNPDLLNQKVKQDGYPLVPPPSSSSSSSSSNKEKENKEKEKNNGFDDDYFQWIKDYPNKKGTDRAKLYYSQWRNNGKTAEQLNFARRAYVEDKQRQGSDTFAHASTFLNPKPRGDSANISDYFNGIPDQGSFPESKKVVEGKEYDSWEFDRAVKERRIIRRDGDWVHAKAIN